MDSYAITTDGLTIDEIAAQITAIKTFPCGIKLYDRVMILGSLDEAYVMRAGLEIGCYLAQDLQDTQKAKRSS